MVIAALAVAALVVFTRDFSAASRAWFLAVAAAAGVMGCAGAVDDIRPLPVLPRLALPDGVPVEHRVLVVVPCLLGRDSSIDALVRQIERHHLASNEAWAQFALLSDFADADAQELPTDAHQLERARHAIER